MHPALRSGPRVALPQTLSPQAPDEDVEAVLAGVEVMAMLAKGQVRAVPATDLPAQRAFVHEVVDLAA